MTGGGLRESCSLPQEARTHYPPVCQGPEFSWGPCCHLNVKFPQQAQVFEPMVSASVGGSGLWGQALKLCSPAPLPVCSCCFLTIEAVCPAGLPLFLPWLSFQWRTGRQKKPFPLSLVSVRAAHEGSIVIHNSWNWPSWSSYRAESRGGQGGWNVFFFWLE